MMDWTKFPFESPAGFDVGHRAVITEGLDNMMSIAKVMFVDEIIQITLELRHERDTLLKARSHPIERESSIIPVPIPTLLLLNFG